MDQTGPKSISLVVNNEESLYTPFSPEAEFTELVKAYIRSKLADEKYLQGISMTVFAQEPIDEERFRTASANWIRSEKTVFKTQERNTIRMLIGTLVFGSIMILMCLHIWLRKTISERVNL